MKILIISDKPPLPGTSGGALAVRASVSGLSRNGAEVDVVAAETQKHRAQVKNSGNGDTLPGKYTCIQINTRIRPIALLLNLFFSSKPYNVRRHYSKRFASGLKEILEKNSYDIIQLEGINTTVYINDIRKITDTAIAYRAHNVESEIWQELADGENNKLKRKYFRTLSHRLIKYEPAAIAKCDFLIPISKYDSDQFKAAGLSIPTFTCPFGSDFLVDKEKQPEDQKDLVYIGSLDWRPNQEGLIWFINKVWIRLLSEKPGIKLRVAGRNAPAWLMDRLNIPGIEFLGEVEDAGEFISSGEILVIPLLSGSGIRVRIIQAMTLGTPVVTSRKGLQGIDASSPEEILLAQNSEQFYESIINILNNKELRAQQAFNARKFIERHYDNCKLNKELLKFYSNNIV